MAAWRVLRAARPAVAAAEGAVSVGAAFPASAGPDLAVRLAGAGAAGGVGGAGAGAGAGPGSRTITSPSGSSVRSTGALPGLLSGAFCPGDGPAPCIKPTLKARRETIRRNLISLRLRAVPEEFSILRLADRLPR